MFRENGPSVCDIALRVNDAEKTVQRAKQLGISEFFKKYQQMNYQYQQLAELPNQYFISLMKRQIYIDYGKLNLAGKQTLGPFHHQD